jgi:hypothetical protein
MRFLLAQQETARDQPTAAPEPSDRHRRAEAELSRLGI